MVRSAPPPSAMALDHPAVPGEAVEAVVDEEEEEDDDDEDELDEAPGCFGLVLHDASATATTAAPAARRRRRVTLEPAD